MRQFAALTLSLVVLLVAAEPSRAQLKLPLADYSGKLQVAISCPDGSTTKFKTKGAVSIKTQQGFNATSTAQFVGKRAGVDCTLDLAMSGTVNDLGRWMGTYTGTFMCSDGTMTQGMGTFDASYKPGLLTMDLAGQDDDCLLTGSFKGKGSPGTALCAALSYKAVGKLSKKYFASWSKYFSTAHIGTSVPKLQAAVTKAQGVFAKATEKAMKKSDKAGGTCTKGPTPPGSVTAKIQADTIDPMMAGFLKGKPIDRFTRSRIAKYQGQYVMALLKAESIFTLKLDPVKRAATIQKARDKFVDRTVDLLTKVSAQGLSWTGPPPQGLAMDVEDFVQFVVDFFE